MRINKQIRYIQQDLQNELKVLLDRREESNPTEEELLMELQETISYVTELCRKRDKAREKYNETYQAISHLEQLFIAV